MGQHAQGHRNDLGEMLPKTHHDRVQVRQRIFRRVLGTEQLLDVWASWAHRRVEKLVLAAEALIENRFRDAGGLRDLPCRRGMPMLAENVSRDTEHFVIGDRLQAAHAAQYTAAACHMPTRGTSPSTTRRQLLQVGRLTYKRALANI